jgi:thiamine-phosphate pyrophosphorylase
MSSRHLLAGLARRLNREAGAPPVPALFFLTDPERTPDPIADARKLPRGTAVIYRHFGAMGRAGVARRLATICRSRGLFLLISADPELAQSVGAHGVHWPEARLPEGRLTSGLVTASAHSAAAIARARMFGADVCIVSPVFPTRSASARASLGLFHASQLAREAGLPVIALGGVNKRTARRLVGRGFAGLAAVDALSA